MAEQGPSIILADDDPDAVFLLEDILSDLSPRPRFQVAGSIERLVDLIRMQEVDLVTLDINFEDKTGPNVEGLEALPTLVQVRPRVPIIVVSGQLDIQRTMQACRDNPQVRGVVDKETPRFGNQLLTAAIEAIEWGQKQRRRADALFDEALQAQQGGMPVDAASLLIEAYQTGDLSSPHRHRFREALSPLLPALAASPHLLVKAYRSLIENCFDNNDEMGTTYFCRKLLETFPEHEEEARNWLILIAELHKRTYTIIDQRLALIESHRANGRFADVLKECDEIQQTLGNVMPNYEYRAQALRELGRVPEAIVANFELADMCVLNGELAGARSALQQVTQLDVDGHFAAKVQDKYDNIKRIAEQLAGLSPPNHYPYLMICDMPDCRATAEQSDGFFVVKPELRHGNCDICSKAFDQAFDGLKGKTISIIGGRFGAKYIAAVKELGAKDVLHHDAIHELGRIPDIVARADAVLIVTGFASHSGTYKAEGAIAKAGKPSARVHFYGVRQVVRGVALELVPRLAGT